MSILWDDSEQNTDGWLAARQGVGTASMADAMRGRTNGLTKQQQAYVDAVRSNDPDPLGAAGYKKAPTSDLVRMALAGQKLPTIWTDAALTYARELARQRLGGGQPSGGYEGFAQRMGHEQEEVAASEYEAQTGYLTERVGFAFTADRRFGASLDRRVLGEPGAAEFKCLLSINSLWPAIVLDDISAYENQCQMQMWLCSLQWVDLCLWVPDMRHLKVVRIHRDETVMAALEDDLIAFDRLVEQQRQMLAKALGLPPDLGRLPIDYDTAPIAPAPTTGSASMASAELEPSF